MIKKIEDVLDGFWFLGMIFCLIYVVGNGIVKLFDLIGRNRRLKTEIYKRPFNDDVVFK